MLNGLSIVCLLVSGNLSAQKASDILDKAAAVYENSNGMSAVFAFHTRSEKQGYAESFEGVIEMRGDKFTLQTPDMKVWYDGKTQWSYVERNEEVNVSIPSGEELQFTNPALLLRMYKKGYTVANKGESTSGSGKAAYDIELTPKKKGDIQKVTLQIEKSSSLPARISIVDKNGGITSIQINQITTGTNQPDDFFTFKEADYPEVEVIDLR